MSWGHWKRLEFKWPPVQTVPKICSVHVLEDVVQVELCISQKWVYMWPAIHLRTSPVQIQTPTYWNLSGCIMTTLPSVLSPSSILLPCLSHCTHFKNVIKIFLLFQNCITWNCVSWGISVLCMLTLRLLMSYIYGSPILDVSRSHTTTQHSR